MLLASIILMVIGFSFQYLGLTFLNFDLCYKWNNRQPTNCTDFNNPNSTFPIPFIISVYSPTNLKPTTIWSMISGVPGFTYQTFCGGIALIVFMTFYIIFDVLKFRGIGFLRTIGMRSLETYIVIKLIQNNAYYIIRDAPWWYIMFLSGPFYTITTYIIILYFEQFNISIKF
jgi:hypothetical protein